MLGFRGNFIRTKDLRLFFATETTYILPAFGTRIKPLQTFYGRRMYLDNTDGGKRVYVDYPIAYYLGNNLIDFRTALTATLNRRLDLTVDYHLLFKGQETI